MFYDGYGNFIDPIVDNLQISKLGITNLEFNETQTEHIITITLERPGLLIGKAGQSLDRLLEFLNKDVDKEVKVKIVESQLWKPLPIVEEEY